MHRGYVKLHRKLIEWEWYGCINTRIVFLHLLLTANHKESRYMGHTIPAGSVVTGRAALAEHVGLSEKQVRNSLAKLEQTGEIARKRASKFSIISLVNWHTYNISESELGQQGASKGPARGQQGATSKECKNEKNVKNNNIMAVRPSDVDEQIWNDFLTLRKTKRAPVTNTALSRLSSQAVKAGISLESVLAVCCEKGWQSFNSSWNWQDSDMAKSIKRNGFENTEYKPEI